jgi:thioredoxin 1
MAHRIQRVNTIDQFEQEISSGIVVCVFSAEWCEPCQTVDPHLQAISNTYEKLKFIKVDVDELYELCVQYGVGVAPTFYAFKDGVKINELVGGNEQQVDEFVKTVSKLVI